MSSLEVVLSTMATLCSIAAFIAHLKGQTELFVLLIGLTMGIAIAGGVACGEH